MSNPNRSLSKLQISTARLLAIYGGKELSPTEVTYAKWFLQFMRDTPNRLGHHSDIYHDYAEYLDSKIREDVATKDFERVVHNPVFRAALKDETWG